MSCADVRRNLDLDEDMAAVEEDGRNRVALGKTALGILTGDDDTTRRRPAADDKSYRVQARGQSTDV